MTTQKPTIKALSTEALVGHTPDWIATKQMWEKIDEEAGEGPDHLHNRVYQRLITDYLRCSIFYLNQFDQSQVMDQQLKRRDLDTVCAYELFQMKKHLAHGDYLEYNHFIKHLKEKNTH